MHLHDSGFLRNAGIEVISRTLKVPGRHLPPPAIKYGEGGMEVVNGLTGHWRQGTRRYLVPATCKVWAAYMVTVKQHRRDRFTFDQFKVFLKTFLNQCQSKGMSIEKPADFNQIDGSEEAVEAEFQLCAQNDVEYILFVTDEAIKNLHNFVKSCEQRYGIVTQDLCSVNALETVTKHKAQTLENIVHKANVKMGGLNYSIAVENP
ncbi:WAGO-2 protein, partial [Aphelenchoides avenae]